MEHLKPVQSCGKTEFIISGAAAKTTSLDNVDNAFYWQAEQLGFFRLDVAAHELAVEAYVVEEQGETAQLVHRRVLKK